jgi:hypothetical protein
MFLILFILSLFLAIGCNMLVNDYWLASVFAAITSSIVFYFMVGSHFGSAGDDIFLNNLMNTLVLAFMTTLIVGAFFHKTPRS